MSFVNALQARTLAQPAKLGSDVFFTAGRLATLTDVLGTFDANGRINTSDARVNFEWNSRVMGTSADYQPQGPLDPWHIASHYTDDEQNSQQLAIVDSDSNAAVDLALRWRVTGDTAALQGVIRILNAWSNIQQFESTNDSALVWANRWPKFIQAAMMIRDSNAYSNSLNNRLKQTTLRGLEISPAYNRSNNWAGWGLVNEFASAMFLKDQARFTKAVKRWRSLFDSSIVNNVPIEEVYRQLGTQGNGQTGLWYSNFSLDSFTIAAEWARYGGEWLYDYQSPDGSTFKGFYENVRHWTRYPEQFPYNTSGSPSSTSRIMAHDDILHALWPHPESQWLLDRFTNGNARDTFGMRQWVLCYRYRPLYG